MSLGTQVQKYREAAGLRFRELTELSGVEVGTINALEKRGSERSVHFIALAKAFGLTLEELADESTDHTARVLSHIKYATKQIKREPPLTAAEPESGYKIDYWWPFVVTPERMRAVLDHHDIARINAYILATVEVRESMRIEEGQI